MRNGRKRKERKKRGNEGIRKQEEVEGKKREEKGKENRRKKN